MRQTTKAALISAIIFSSSFAPAFAALPPSIHADGEEIAVSIEDSVSKIQWEDQYITFVQFDEAKIAEVTNKYKGIDPKAIANRGISGDFLTVSAQRHGKMKTDFGTFEIIWTNVADRGYGAVISNGNDYKDIRLFDIDEKKSIMYGDYSSFLGGVIDGKTTALALVKKANVFEGRPELYTKNEVVSLSDYDISWESQWSAEKDGAKKIVGSLNDQRRTEIDIYATKSGARYLTLADGTRVFTKMTANPEIVLLFYIDFDNEKDPTSVRFVTLGSVKSSQFAPDAVYEDIFDAPMLQKPFVQQP